VDVGPKTKQKPKFCLPRDFVPSHVTTEVVVSVYLSLLPSRFTSKSSTDLRFLVTL